MIGPRGPTSAGLAFETATLATATAVSPSSSVTRSVMTKLPSSANSQLEPSPAVDTTSYVPSLSQSHSHCTIVPPTSVLPVPSRAMGVPSSPV